MVSNSWMIAKRNLSFGKKSRVPTSNHPHHYPIVARGIRGPETGDSDGVQCYFCLPNRRRAILLHSEIYAGKMLFLTTSLRRRTPIAIWNVSTMYSINLLLYTIIFYPSFCRPISKIHRSPIAKMRVDAFFRLENIPFQCLWRVQRHHFLRALTVQYTLSSLIS